MYRLPQAHESVSAWRRPERSFGIFPVFSVFQFLSDWCRVARARSVVKHFDHCREYCKFNRLSCVSALDVPKICRVAYLFYSLIEISRDLTSKRAPLSQLNRPGFFGKIHENPFAYVSP